MTARDRILVSVVVTAAVVAGFWFAVLGPKRAEAARASAKVAAAESRLATARTKAASAQQAKARYVEDSAAVAMLGTAVPADDGVASLVHQLESVAHDGHIDFDSIDADAGAAPAAQAPASQPGAGATGGSAGAAATAATLPPGATVGADGFPSMPFALKFTGTYFDLERLLARIHGFVSVDGGRVDVRGRLLTVDGVSVTTDGGSALSATLKARAYVLPAAQDATGAATPGATTTPSATSSAIPAISTATPSGPTP